MNPAVDRENRLQAQMTKEWFKNLQLDVIPGPLLFLSLLLLDGEGSERMLQERCRRQGSRNEQLSISHPQVSLKSVF
jgi:hypothetical protein